ncbi:hypothetical protein [Sphingomonas sp.]|uniref:hypothetical protein n=1 Tax=Sphingomonas sp. TaxID=28214 RepID=UPI0025F60909|nr:hypothetical protein [Sphingomonas sp.]
MLAASSSPGDLQSRIDCAELALALDFRDEARLLFETIFIAGGYDEAALARQEQLRRETLLWEQGELRPRGASKDCAALQARVDCAAADLAACLTVDGTASIASINDGKPTPSELAGNEELSKLTADLAGHVHATHRALQSPLAPDALAETIRALTTHPLVRGKFTARDYVDAPIPTLIGLCAAEAMRHFLKRRHIILSTRLASPALIHKTAGFARACLGPWLSNASYLVPDNRGLISLAAAACMKVGSQGEFHSALALLSSDLDEDRLADFIDLLADQGLLQSLDLLAERYRISATASDRIILWRLRDAAIDLGAIALAIDMQALLLRLSPHSKVEAEVLVELRTSDVSKGYGSTTGRRDLRRSRRRALGFAVEDG